MKQRETYHIGEQGLDIVFKLYKKLIILFHTSKKTRLITICFPDLYILPLYITEGIYDEPIRYFFDKYIYHNNTNRE
jgi:hypothetical protein